MQYLPPVIRISFICLIILFWSAASLAVMPPYVYEERAQNSKIKAIAVVVRVEKIEETKQSTLNKIYFKTEKSIGPAAPAQFTAQCYSVDRKWQKPPVGGTLYYYPVEGQRVFVTVSADGGQITSYTKLTPELEKALLEDPGSVKFGMGEAYVEGQK